VRTLNTQEDRLEQIERELARGPPSADHCREKINELLAKLEYDATV